MSSPLFLHAHDIVELLARRHSKDVFVPECKTGPSVCADSCPRMDAWAMKRSWVHPLTYGYEVKVSRSDFLRDDKWHQYLNFCTHFYFVSANDAIQPSEVPAAAGLLVTTKNGRSLLTRKKAPARIDLEIPESLWRYLLMARSHVVKDSGFRKLPDRQYWKNWLTQKKRDLNFGHLVGDAIRQTIESKVREVQYENEKLKQQMGKYDRIRQLMDSMGLDGDSPDFWRAKEQLLNLKSAFPLDFKRVLAKMKDAICVMDEWCEKVENRS